MAESTRVEAFSDGVLAIALTLLVLDLHSEAEPGHFAETLADQWPAYVAYLGAFLNIASIWINHHDLFTRIKGVDIQLVTINLPLLLVSSLLPWPTAVLSSAFREGSRDDQVFGVLIYAFVAFCVAPAFVALYSYAARHSSLLVNPDDAAHLRTARRRAFLAMGAYPIAAACAFIAPTVSLVAFAVVPAFFIATLFASNDKAEVAAGPRA